MVKPIRNARLRGARGDEGFTLTELMVVMALMGIVMAAAYMFIYSANVSQANTEREAALSRSVTMPLLTMERLIVQNSAIAILPGPTPYRMAILTDQDSNDQLEEHTFEAVRDPVTLLGYVNLTTYRTNPGGAHEGAALQNGHIAWDNANVRDNKPLFRYYDKNGSEITSMGAVSSLARMVEVQLRVTSGVGSAIVTETHNDKIMFRNR